MSPLIGSVSDYCLGNPLDGRAITVLNSVVGQGLSFFTQGEILLIVGTMNAFNSESWAFRIKF